MTRSTTTVLALMVSVLPAATPAQTAAGLNDLARNAKALDKNFEVADKNHDGLLTKQEAETGPTPFIAGHFDAIDAGHRGAVSLDDVHRYIGKQLKRTSQPSSPTSSGRS